MFVCLFVYACQGRDNLPLYLKKKKLEKKIETAQAAAAEWADCGTVCLAAVLSVEGRRQ